jgi:ubiquinone/menaquinone biosynthesis C-methylase UbiE
MTDEVLADQVGYYRRRASEYDATAYGDVEAARTRIARLVAEMRPAGRVLEIACGTGLWTAEIASIADAVTALDAAPETIAIARARVGERVAVTLFPVNSPQLMISARSSRRIAASRSRHIWRASGVCRVQSVTSSTIRSGSLLR